MIIFLGKKTSDHDTITLLESEVKHCVKTLRKQIGDLITIHDGEGHVYQSSIVELSKSSVKAEIIETQTYPRLQPLHLSISLTKNLDRIEWLISKATEIGVTDITFIKCHRSEKQHFRYERMKRIIESACKQSLKYHFPRLNENVVSFKDSLKESYQYSHRFIASYSPNNSNITTLIHDIHSGHILIGPEGDFATEEVAIALGHGYQKVNLGNQRLRTETAGLYAVTLLKANMDNIF